MNERNQAILRSVLMKSVSALSLIKKAMRELETMEKEPVEYNPLGTAEHGGQMPFAKILPIEESLKISLHLAHAQLAQAVASSPDAEVVFTGEQD